MPKTLSKKQKKIVSFSVAGVVIAAVAAAAIAVCSYIFRDEELKISNNNLAQVIETAPDALGKTYDNIILPDSISSVGTPKALYTFTVQNYMPLEDVKKLVVELSNKLNTYTITEDDLDVSLYSDYMDKYEPGDPTYVPNFRGSEFCEYTEVDNDVDPMLDDEEGIYSVVASSDGAFVISSPFLVMGACAYTEWEKTFEIGKDDISGVSYNVYGEQYSIQEAIDYADSLIEDHKKYLFSDVKGLSVKLKQVIVRKNEKSQSGEDEYSYYLRYSYCYNGVEVVFGGGMGDNDEFDCPKQGLDIIIPRRDSFATMYKSFKTAQFSPEMLSDDFITLGSAIDRASQILAPNFIQDVKRVYMAYLGKRYYTDRDEPDPTLYSMNEPLPEMTFRPVWCLEINNNINMEERFEHYPPARYLCIDMITGEILLYDESKSQPALTEEMITNEKQDPTFEESWN